MLRHHRLNRVHLPCVLPRSHSLYYTEDENSFIGYNPEPIPFVNNRFKHPPICSDSTSLDISHSEPGQTFLLREFPKCKHCQEHTDLSDKALPSLEPICHTSDL
jgi:hypothetical protein